MLHHHLAGVSHPLGEEVRRVTVGGEVCEVVAQVNPIPTVGICLGEVGICLGEEHV